MYEEDAKGVEVGTTHDVGGEREGAFCWPNFAPTGQRFTPKGPTVRGKRRIPCTAYQASGTTLMTI